MGQQAITTDKYPCMYAVVQEDGRRLSWQTSASVGVRVEGWHNLWDSPRQQRKRETKAGCLLQADRAQKMADFQASVTHPMVHKWVHLAAFDMKVKFTN